MRHLIFGIIWTIFAVIMVAITIYDAYMGKHGMAIFSAFCVVIDSVDAYLEFRKWREWKQLMRLFDKSSISKKN